MRKTTILWLVLALICGTGIFHTSQRVHDERLKISSLEASITKEQESLRVLNAEWSYLNQPARLEKLSKAYLHLAPLKGSQFVKLEDIPLRGTAAAQAPVVTTTAPVVKHTVVAIKKPVKQPEVVIVPDNDAEDDQAELQEEPETKTTATIPVNTHNFNDLMKNLRSGVE